LWLPGSIWHAKAMLPRNLRQYSNRKVFIALGGIIGLSLAATAATTLALSALLLYRQGAQNYNDSRVQLQALMADIYRAVSFEREYLLTRNPADLTAYQGVQRAMPTRLTKVEQALAPATIAPEVARIRPLVRQLRDEQDRLLALAQAGDIPAALAGLQSGTELQLIGQISQLTSRIQESDVAQLTADRNRINQLSQLARNISLGSFLITLILAALVYWLFLKAIQAERLLDKAKDEFVSLASHQLRTPATGVKSILSTLAAGDIGPLASRQHYFVRKALEANNRGLQIIEDLLNVAKADAGRLVLNPTSFSLTELLSTVVSEQRPAIEARRLTLRLEQPNEPVTISADRDKLYMAVGNLLDNARKYTPEGGSITVSLAARSNEVRIAVADTGIGIASSDLKHIFDRFQRSSDAAASKTEGTGLGLYLVRSIAELHQGSIKASSRKNRGSKFVMIIPLKKGTSS
jgi:signal transduction histidine kinase